MYVCVRVICCASFYDFPDSGASFVFGTVPTVWHLLFLELSRQWGIFCFWNCPDSGASFVFGTVPTVGHLLFSIFNANACYLSGYSGFPHKTDHHDITEILLKVALNTITLTPNPMLSILTYVYNSVIDMT
jgi:hypothetical protein